MLSKAGLAVFLAVTVGRGSATGVSWLDARDAAKHPMMHNTAPRLRTNNYLWPQMLTVLRLINPYRDEGGVSPGNLHLICK